MLQSTLPRHESTSAAIKRLRVSAEKFSSSLSCLCDAVQDSSGSFSAVVSLGGRNRPAQHRNGRLCTSVIQHFPPPPSLPPSPSSSPLLEKKQRQNSRQNFHRSEFSIISKRHCSFIDKVISRFTGCSGEQHRHFTDAQGAKLRPHCSRFCCIATTATKLEIVKALGPAAGGVWEHALTCCAAATQKAERATEKGEGAGGQAWCGVTCTLKEPCSPRDREQLHVVEVRGDGGAPLQPDHLCYKNTTPPQSWAGEARLHPEMERCSNDRRGSCREDRRLVCWTRLLWKFFAIRSLGITAKCGGKKGNTGVSDLAGNPKTDPSDFTQTWDPAAD
ncbi:hypothetical protein FQA47_009671 [Oryzias melastigma]|uniref:Uncharacterized protein n=1 Tax=Oryzias melastigma TaxID=30732 RepID=A0A834F4Q1_ORYME|nr:hypothetical protein FQA47_009671 [Oryzias melastigma]